MYPFSVPPHTPVKGRADESAHLLVVVATYRPARIPQEEWASCGPFVRDCVQLLDPKTVSAAYTAIKTIAPFVAWAHRQGLPLDREKIFTPSLVERYVQTECQHLLASSRGTIQSNLRRYGRALTRRAPWPQPSNGTRPKGCADPYTDEEVERILKVCSQQRTVLRRYQMQILVALTLGAGLTPHEAWVARSGDIVEHTGLVCVVTRGSAARIVPVTAPFDTTLWELRTAFPEGPFWGVNPSRTKRTRIHQVIEEAEIPPGCPPIVAHRLRTTWVLRHLEAGVDLAGLARLAGVKTVTISESAIHRMRRVPDDVLFPSLARR